MTSWKTFGLLLGGLLSFFAESNNQTLSYEKSVSTNTQPERFSSDSILAKYGKLNVSEWNIVYRLISFINCFHGLMIMHVFLEGIIWSFPLRISSVNVTKSTRNRGFGHIYWRNPYWKTSFLCNAYNHWIIKNRLQIHICRSSYLPLKQTSECMNNGGIRLSLQMQLKFIIV